MGWAKKSDAKIFGGGRWGAGGEERGFVAEQHPGDRRQGGHGQIQPIPVEPIDAIAELLGRIGQILNVQLDFQKTFRPRRRFDANDMNGLVESRINHHSFVRDGLALQRGLRSRNRFDACDAAGGGQQQD